VISPDSRKVLKASMGVDQTAPPVFQRTGRSLSTAAEAGRAEATSADPIRRPAARRFSTDQFWNNNLNLIIPVASANNSSSVEHEDPSASSAKGAALM
jgi:hypothetical protein